MRAVCGRGADGGDPLRGGDPLQGRRGREGGGGVLDDGEGGPADGVLRAKCGLGAGPGVCVCV